MVFHATEKYQVRRFAIDNILQSYHSIICERTRLVQVENVILWMDSEDNVYFSHRNWYRIRTG